jgi:hypothetical protein
VTGAPQKNGIVLSRDLFSRLVRGVCGAVFRVCPKMLGLRHTASFAKRRFSSFVRCGPDTIVNLALVASVQVDGREVELTEAALVPSSTPDVMKSRTWIIECPDAKAAGAWAEWAVGTVSGTTRFARMTDGMYVNLAHVSAVVHKDRKVRVQGPARGTSAAGVEYPEHELTFRDMVDGNQWVGYVMGWHDTGPDAVCVDTVLGPDRDDSRYP